MYASVDIDIGIEEGHEIEYIEFEDDYIGYTRKQNSPIFDDYVEKHALSVRIDVQTANGC